jgi:hypothetical protein
MNAAVDRLLRSEREFAVGAGSNPLVAIAWTVALAGAVHGLALGSYALRGEQALYSALKIPLLLAVSTALCIPSFFVLNTILGLRSDFSAAMRGILCSQAVVAVVLASFAPIVLFLFASGLSYRSSLAASGVLFFAASMAGQRTLARHYRPLIAANPRHRAPRALWLLLYWFVTIQLAWVLRPFIGAPDLPPSFFREDAWTNAYVGIANSILGS